MGECKSEEHSITGFQTEDAAEGQENEKLEDKQPRHDQRDCSRLMRNEREVDTCSHRDKKEAKQQSLEGLDVSLELHPILAFGENDAGDEGSECW